MYFKDFLNNQSKTLIMGILNLTPDSFYDGNKYIKNNNLVNRFKILEKVDLIDVGCETSKPGSLKIRALDELKRLKLIDKIPFLDNKFYSIDTYKSNIYRYGGKFKGLSYSVEDVPITGGEFSMDRKDGIYGKIGIIKGIETTFCGNLINFRFIAIHPSS